ncbi:replication initiation protein [Pelagibacterium sp.]|uniref:replication initiation protein n=1 Tax=Pelagibacterium sp. TaxID=1967288 RepID=UPI003A8CFC26
MLPETLEIPITLAATIQFDPDLTARDRSLLLAVSYLAAREEYQDELVSIPDLPLRRALGDLRRLDEGREVSRYDRLEKGRIRTDERVPDLEEGVDAPVVPRGMRRRLVRGAYQWSVDNRIRTAFAVTPREPVIELPLEILRSARSRYTLPMALRALAWGAGEYDKRWVRRNRDGDDVLILRLPVEEMRAEIGADPKTPPVDLMRRELEPAIREITTVTDLSLEAMAVKAPSMRKGGGRVRWIDIQIDKIAAKQVSDAPVSTPRASAQVVPLPTDPDPWGDEVEF